ncbi:MAG: PadR family transcriptional regulator [Candidatus Thorarchaeota archaeon]|jgi:DNA-binding PadR family transcriptional regulator
MSKQVKLFLPTPEKLTPIQAIILIQLLDTSKYGYEILRNLRDAFHGAWEPKTGTVYPTLQALEKKGYVSKKVKEEKTHYRLTKQGRGKLREMSDYVADYLIFNSRFIESSVANMPPSFTREVFTKIHLAGIDEVLPEATVLNAISELSDPDLKRAFLDLRKSILRRKLKLVQKHLKDLED